MSSRFNGLRGTSPVCYGICQAGFSTSPTGSAEAKAPQQAARYTASAPAVTAYGAATATPLPTPISGFCPAAYSTAVSATTTTCPFARSASAPKATAPAAVCPTSTSRGSPTTSEATTLPCIPSTPYATDAAVCTGGITATSPTRRPPPTEAPKVFTPAVSVAIGLTRPSATEPI